MLCSRSLLKAVAILEKDSNQDILWTWEFPSIEAPERCFIGTKVSFEAGEFLVLHFNGDAWFYTLSQPVSSDPSGNLHLVQSAAIILQTNEFHPEKYLQLLTAFSEVYLSSGSPPDILRLYLAAQTEQSVQRGDIIMDWKALPSALDLAPVKDLVQLLQLETILVYTALLLRLRVVVYHHCSTALRRALTAMAALMAHRERPFAVMYPLLCNSESDIQLLRGKTSYLAGFTDASVAARQDLRDLLVSLPSAEISISPSAKETLARCKVHKEIALFLSRCADNGRYTDGDVVKEMSSKTRSLVASIAQIIHQYPTLTAAKAIQMENLPPAMESFFKAVANVERIHN